jgi:hypothetical protein
VHIINTFPRKSITNIMGQDIASAQLLKGISVGTILWIKELADDDGSKRYGLPSNCFQHPCVVVDLAALRKGFAQIYVVCAFMVHSGFQGVVARPD